MNHVIVALDGTRGDARAIEWAADYAEETGAFLNFVYVVPWPVLLTISAAQGDASAYLDERRTHIECTVLDPLRERGVAAHLHVARGDLADTIVADARKVRPSLIVVSSHGGFARRLERRLEHKSVVPIVVVPPSRTHAHAS